MKGVIHAIRQVFDGIRPINEQIKYQALGLCIALVHFSFMVTFYTLKITPLFIYNVVITVFYCVLSWIIGKKERYASVFISAFIEILLHSVLASLMLGWDWGFMLYTIALIPLAFYLTYTLPYFKKSVSAPITISVIVCMVYVAVIIITNRMEPLYSYSVNLDAVSGFYYYNTMLTFALILACSILFAIEIRYMQHNLEKENQDLEQLANYDPLTHLLNRRSMTTHLRQAMEQATGINEIFCLIMADIDNFKKVNDTYGHACGDKVLLEVAHVISGNVREEDYVCRWGGEEILILLRSGKDVAVQVANRICKDVADCVISYKEMEISVTLTLGVAEYQEKDTIRTLIDRADEKLYYGKNHGKNQVVK